MKKSVLTKLFTREHSLFYFCLWHESDLKGIKKWIGLDLKNNLFVCEGKKRKCTVWYDLTYGGHKFGILWHKIRENVEKNPLFFEEVKKDFYKYWFKVLPYFKQSKEIKNIEELKKYYCLLVKLWMPMAVIINIPEIGGMPQNFKNEAVKIREETQYESNCADKIYQDFFSENYPAYIEIKDSISPREVFSLQKRKFTAKELGKIRRRLGGYFLLDGKIFLKSELSKILKERKIYLDFDSEIDFNELKGVGVCKGFVQGRVKLVLYKDQIQNFKPGQILVSEMTGIDFVPAMKKALAIITDEGGMTSHAAIVSRELRKPCIVGTKIATKVFKDGDLVEVDANKGIVRKLT